ncbi:PREDICTED: terminal uridylyltransferase Tailor [Rhagoletis zephyria]|uniref:terminal uridylyltransferase Tailor n=1 Tax=Rhagoletis zephyria TaxID=28612 RepID=UPI0008117309|nr:PREDICTED: terminal uridylyltransferase Tailor [Rhagoletis zephyria]
MARLPSISANSDPACINDNGSNNPSNEKEDGVEVNTKTINCTVCSQTFDNLKECLKHELLQHGTKKVNRPQKSLRNKVNAVLNNLKSDDQHARLRDALRKCEPGQELSSIFKFHRMNDENLELVYERINACLKKELQSLRALNIYPFGSFASALALRDSDIDLYIEHADGIQTEHSTNWSHKSPSQRSIFNRINNILHRSNCFSDVFAIRQARVPIIKCKHTPTGFSLDINLSCPSSVHNTNFLRDLLQFDTRFHELMIFLKVWAKQLQLIGRGNMTSYCLITLVIFYLQQAPALLPSIKKLQENVPDRMVVGVNYSYDLNIIPTLPRELTTSKLIKGFFNYYRSFEFEKSLIAPYLGEAVPLEKFKDGTFDYPAYHNQLRVMTILNGKPVEPFQTERCVCVQDPFSLNHNVGKSIAPPNLEYFRNCMNHACSVYQDHNISTDAQRYEALLYGIIENIARTAGVNPTSAVKNINQKTSEIIATNTTGIVSSNNLPNELSYRFSPSRTELRVIAMLDNANNSKTLHELWVQYYLEAIPEIITDIYCLDMQSATPTHRDKHQRLENTDRTHTWLLSGSVDQWTGRLHQRFNNKTFMELQLEQTRKFAEERRQNAAFAVQLNATLILNVLSDSAAIELILTPRHTKGIGLVKKDPLRKFFMMFKCSMQNFNLKERLQARGQTNF